jgi:hypothetical protein
MVFALGSMPIDPYRLARPFYFASGTVYRNRRPNSLTRPELKEHTFVVLLA